MNILHGKRIVYKYTSEFETLLGRMTIQDEATWLKIYIWELRWHLVRAVPLKYQTTIAQALGHAEATKPAIRVSQRPNIEGASGSRQPSAADSQGGSQVGP